MRRVLASLVIALGMLAVAGCEPTPTDTSPATTASQTSLVRTATPSTGQAPTSAPTARQTSAPAPSTTLSPADQASLAAFLKGQEDAKRDAETKKAAADKQVLEAYLRSLNVPATTKAPQATTRAPVVTKPPATTRPPTVTQPPASRCPAGTYVNTAGNTVCRPTAAPSAPAGATAVCGDGTTATASREAGHVPITVASYAGCRSALSRPERSPVWQRHSAAECVQPTGRGRWSVMRRSSFPLAGRFSRLPGFGLPLPDR
jgi:hypothetical protein